MSIIQKYHCTIKRLLIMIISTLIILSHSAAVSAETESSLLFTLSETRNMSITVTYDKEKPAIAFISPSGEKYKEGALTGDKMTVKHIEGAINCLIPNAAPGDWYIEYDKLSNTSLDANYAPYAEAIRIESFGIENISENTANVNFEVSYADNPVYQYVIYAAITDKDSHITGKRELAAGSAAAGSLATVDVPLSSLSSYDNYHLMLEVYLDSSGIEVFDTAITNEGFSYTNNTTPVRIDDFYTEINLTEETVLIDWTDYAVSYCDEYIVAVYTPDDLLEPMFSAVYDPGITSTSLNINTTAEFIRIELSYRINGITSEISRKKIFFNNGIAISISTPEQTSSAQAVIEYDVKSAINASVSINGDTEEIVLNGSGQFSVSLGEFSNDLQVSYSPEKNVLFIVKNSIYSDRIAPILLLYENKTTITVTEPGYTLVGETEPGCVLTINQEIAALREDGTFLHELALSNGNNEFTVISTDKAGNSSMQKINIRKGSGSANAASNAASNEDPAIPKRYLPLILTFMASIIIVACIFIFSRIYNKQAPNGRFMAVLSILRNIFLILSPISLIVWAYFVYKRQAASKIINSADYLDLVDQSVQDAYQAIVEFERYNKLFIVACYIVGSFIAVILLLTLLLYLLKKYKDKKDKEGI